jgi:hypothetical protein
METICALVVVKRGDMMNDDDKKGCGVEEG